MSRTLRCSAAVFALLLPNGCISTPRTPRITEADYPGTLQPPLALAEDVLWRQHVTAIWPDGERSFDAAVQKLGDNLTVMGLSPAGNMGFAFILQGRNIRVQNNTDEELPIPARFILLDVQRVFFPWLETSGTQDLQGRREGTSGAEQVVERWCQGRLIERSFQRLDAEPEGRIAVHYEWGRKGWIAPTRAVLDNGWFGYRLIVDTVEETRLAP